MTFQEYHALKLGRTSRLLQEKCIELALQGKVAPLIFALKNISGWSDDPVDEELTKRTISINYNVIKRKEVE